MKPRLTREQKTTIFYGILCLVLILVVLQLWLLTATMNASSAATSRSSGRRRWRAWPASAERSACCATSPRKGAMGAP